MNSTKVDGTTVKIGDYVSFKSDIEQSGKIVGIRQSLNGVVLVLEDSNGTRTTQQASKCWLE